MAVWKMSQALKLLRLLSSNSNLLPRINSGLYYQRCQGVYELPCRALSCSLSLRIVDLNEETSAKSKKKKTLEIPKITLIHPDNTMTVTELENAQKIAKRRNLKLIKTNDVDTKSDRVIYKLLSSGDIVNDKVVEKDEKPKATGTKSTKIFYTQSTITKRDFLIKIKNIVKVLNKKHTVKVVISSSGGNMDNLFNIIKEEVNQTQNTINITKAQNASTIFITPSLTDEANLLNKSENTVKS